MASIIKSLNAPFSILSAFRLASRRSCLMKPQSHGSIAPGDVRVKDGGRRSGCPVGVVNGADLFGARLSHRLKI